MKKKYIIIIISLISLMLFIIGLFLIVKIWPKKTYSAADFNIEVIKSDIDYNGNGIDDYTDIVNGAIKEAHKKPKYKSAYYDGGYPPDGEGVCTDLIWRSLKYAGYDLKQLVDTDIKNNKSNYTRIDKIDSNIDFRRVYNLYVFFENNTTKLTNDINKIEEFQPGDILIFKNQKHIGIVSNKRNKKGVPYLLHHTPGLVNHLASLEEDVLLDYEIIGHYRFELKNK